MSAALVRCAGASRLKNGGSGCLLQAAKECEIRWSMVPLDEGISATRASDFKQKGYRSACSTMSSPCLALAVSGQR